MKEKIFLPNLKVDAEKINAKVLVCGDPERAEKIASRLDEYEEVSYNREYRLFNGKKEGISLTIVSHGVGAAGAAVCFEELIKGGAKQIIRIGTAGSLSTKITDGDIVIATGAVREDGLTQQLVSLAYPAVADHKLICKLEKASEELKIDTETGLVLTLAAFYPELDGIPNNYYSKANVIAVEMEVSSLLVIANLHGVEAGAVLAIDGIAIDFDADKYNPHRNKVVEAVDKEIDIAIKALVS